MRTGKLLKVLLVRFRWAAKSFTPEFSFHDKPCFKYVMFNFKGMHLFNALCTCNFELAIRAGFQVTLLPNPKP